MGFVPFMVLINIYTTQILHINAIVIFIYFIIFCLSLAIKVNINNAFDCSKSICHHYYATKRKLKSLILPVNYN